MASLAALEGGDTPMSDAQRLLLAQLQSRVGTVVRSKWRIEALLGLGGMGAVFSATHRNGYACALKMLLPSFSSNPEVISRFLKEGYIANEVKHPGVVTVLDDDVTEDGAHFLVMELLDGESFDRALRRCPEGIDPAEATRVGHDVLDVLAAAHARSIVHRDVKPENVFLLGDGRVKVLDFGIAGVRRAGSGHGKTQDGQIMGTPGFMPPEQARGFWDDVDARSDVWSVGATLFVALTGRPLRVGRTTNEELLQAMTEPAPPLRSVRADVPLALADAVDRALMFEKRLRWADARQMQHALSAALGDHAPTVHTPPPPRRHDFDPPREEAGHAAATAAPASARPADGAGGPLLGRAASEILLSTSRSHVADAHADTPAGLGASRLRRVAIAGVITATAAVAFAVLRGASPVVPATAEARPFVPPEAREPVATSAPSGSAAATAPAEETDPIVAPPDRPPARSAATSRPPGRAPTPTTAPSATPTPTASIPRPPSAPTPTKASPRPSFDPLVQRR